MNKTNESTLFFEELKKLRISQDIELSEISNRTKINLEYLESIEKGSFDFLPYIYVRLFLKAYCSEIGSDIDKRNYIVSNQKIEDAGFKAKRDLSTGIKELVKALPLLKRTQFANI